MVHNHRPKYMLDNTDPELLQRLPETLSDIQSHGPVAWSEASGGYWVLTKYDDVVEASNDWETYTVTQGIMIPPTGATMPVIPAELDPPRHTKLRKLVLPDFTDRSLQKWRPRLQQIIEDAFAPVLPLGEADFIRDIAHPIPVLAISLILGIDSDWRRIRELSANFLDAVGQPELARQRAEELEEYLEQEIDCRRGKPVTDLLGAYVNATIEGEPLPPMEVLGLVQLMVVAGHETTVNGMGTMVYRLVSEPGLRDRILADRTLCAPMIDEVLRLHPPVWNLARTVAKNTEVRGSSLCPGEKVMLAYIAANRDPDVFAEPDVFDVDRPGLSRHLAFGIGRHRCIGEPLAKLELRLVLEYILATLPDIASGGDPVWGGGTNAHGLSSLPVRFAPRQRG